MINGAHEQSAWSKPGVEDRLRELVARNLSASQISNALRADGHAVTRNAVVGKVSRMGLQLKGGAAATKPCAPPVRKRPAPHRTLGAQAPEIMPDRKAGTGLVSLIGAAFGDCRWPVSGAGAGLMVCGKPTHPGKAYCCEHASLAYVGVSNPRKGEAWWLDRYVPTAEAAE